MIMKRITCKNKKKLLKENKKQQMHKEIDEVITNLSII